MVALIHWDLGQDVDVGDVGENVKRRRVELERKTKRASHQTSEEHIKCT